jgi:hypothetical protein
MCYLSKNPSKYFSFCDTVFSSWGRSGRISYLPYCLFQKEKKEKKRRKKCTRPWYVNVGGHPMESVSHGLRKEKKVGRSAKLYKRAQKCQSISKTCFIFIWKIVRTPLPVVGKDNHLSKPIFFISLFYK